MRKLCQNPICLGRRKLRFERKQLPQVVDIRHFRIELMERSEPQHLFRNQQVAGSIPAGGSSYLESFAEVEKVIPKTANVLPTNKAVNFARSFTGSLYASLSMPFMAAWLSWPFGLYGLLVGPAGIQTLLGATISTPESLLFTVTSSSSGASPGRARNSTRY